MQVYLVKNFLYQQDTFSQECEISPLQVYLAETICAQGMLIFHPACSFIQFSFFDALPNYNEAVELLIEKLSNTKNNVEFLVTLNK